MEQHEILLAEAVELTKSETPWAAFAVFYAADALVLGDESRLIRRTMEDFEQSANARTLLAEAQRLMHSSEDGNPCFSGSHRIVELLDKAMVRCTSGAEREEGRRP